MMGAVLIGLGMVADTHLAAIRDAQNIHLIGVMGRDAGKAKDFAQKAETLMGHSVEVFTHTYDFATRDDVNFVILATPPDARLDIVTELVSAGKPILMEKPIERTLAAAECIVHTCAQSSTPLGIVLQHRAREASRALKDVIEAGALGDIVSAEIRVPWWRDQAYYDAPGRGTYARDGGGVMINQAIHTLDLALWVLGPFSSIQALMHTTNIHDMEAEDWAGAVFTTTSGTVGTLTASTAAYPGDAESITLHGTQAGAHLASGVLTLTYLDGRTAEYGGSSSTGAGADPMAFTHDWHQTILENFAAHLASDEPLLASAQSALNAHRVIDAMTQSSASGKRVEIPQS